MSIVTGHWLDEERSIFGRVDEMPELAERHPSAPASLPDFVIVGAPKCGTTSLATWLGEHPHIFMSPIKEPNYFCFDAGKQRVTTRLVDYQHLFKRAKSFQACGEASTAYLFSDVAVPAIMQANPKAKIIAMVRNPIEMLISLHAQKLFNLKEDEPDFEKAWRLSPDRAKGLNVPSTCPAPRFMDYQSLGKLGWQISRLMSWVPRGQLHLIVFDDLATNPAAIYRDSCLFLGSRPATRVDFEVINPRKRMRSLTFGWLVRRPPWPGRALKKAALRWFPAGAKTLSRAIHKLNSRRAAPTLLSNAFRREMIAFYREDIDALSRLLGRDLSYWRE